MSEMWPLSGGVIFFLPLFIGIRFAHAIRRNPLVLKDLGLAGRAPRDVNPLIVTTYDDSPDSQVSTKNLSVGVSTTYKNSRFPCVQYNVSVNTTNGG